LPDVAKWVLKGYQADIDANQTTPGRSTRSGVAAFWRCADVFSYIPGRKKVGSSLPLGDGAELKNFIKIEDWNEMHIIARGT